MERCRQILQRNDYLPGAPATGEGCPMVDDRGRGHRFRLWGTCEHRSGRPVGGGVRGRHAALEIVYKHAYAFLAEPKYPPDFEHFDWVNPDAPKGGRMRISVSGQWDNINPCSVPAGHRVLGVDVERPYANLVHDALMDWSADEPASIYGRLAEGIAVADDGAWIAFRIRDGARWHDGKPSPSTTCISRLRGSPPRHPRRSPAR